MFAHVPTMPGPVTEITPGVPSDGNPAEWHPCGGMVEVGWNFDGNSFQKPPESMPEPAAMTLAQLAQVELYKSDTTVIRCLAVGVQVPAEWQTYRTALRAVVASGTGPLPVQPAFPPGT